MKYISFNLRVIMDYYFLLKCKTEEKNCSFLLDYLKFYDNTIVKLLSNCPVLLHCESDYRTLYELGLLVDCRLISKDMFILSTYLLFLDIPHYNKILACTLEKRLFFPRFIIASSSTRYSL